jgi:hypothetical protein
VYSTNFSFAICAGQCDSVPACRNAAVVMSSA